MGDNLMKVKVMTELEQLKKRRDLLENEWVELRDELSLIEMDLDQLEEQIEELENQP